MVFVRFGLPYGYVFHWKTLSTESLVYFIAHLERCEGDARTYTGYDLFTLRAVSSLHPVERFRKNAIYRTPPAGMNCGDNAMLLII